MKPLRLFSAVTASLSMCFSAGALAIQDVSSVTNERFANSASFIMNDYDLSGVGRASNATWGTLISRNVILSAFHYHPADSNTITFYANNSPGSTSVVRTVVSGMRIGTTDIWVGVLDSPVPVGYAVYEFATENITNSGQFNGSVYKDVEAFMVGRSPYNNFGSLQDVGVGRNVLNAWADSINVSGTIDDAVLAYIEDPPGDVLYESTLVGGDSGAPLFVDFNELDSNYELRLVGMNWFVGDTGGDNPIDLNGFTYLGNDDAAIQAYIDNHPVPEPGSVAVLLVGIGMVLKRRRA